MKKLTTGLFLLLSQFSVEGAINHIDSSHKAMIVINYFDSDTELSVEEVFAEDLLSIPSDQKKSSIKTIIKSRNEFRQWKKSHQEEAEIIVTELKRLVKELGQRESSNQLFKGDSSIEAITNASQVMSQRLKVSSAEIQHSCSAGYSDTSWHLIGYGVSKYSECVSSEGAKGSYQVTLRTFGPGLGYGEEIMALACSGQLKGMNVGFGSTFIALPTIYPSAAASFSFLFGSSGVCAFIRGGGAVGLPPVAAGVNLLSISKK